jgi:hypothetical protein
MYCDWTWLHSRESFFASSAVVLLESVRKQASRGGRGCTATGLGCTLGNPSPLLPLLCCSTRFASKQVEADADVLRLDFFCTKLAKYAGARGGCGWVRLRAVALGNVPADSALLRRRRSGKLLSVHGVYCLSLGWVGCSVSFFLCAWPGLLLLEGSWRFDRGKKIL